MSSSAETVSQTPKLELAPLPDTPVARLYQVAQLVKDTLLTEQAINTDPIKNPNPARTIAPVAIVTDSYPGQGSYTPSTVYTLKRPLSPLDARFPDRTTLTWLEYDDVIEPYEGLRQAGTLSFTNEAVGRDNPSQTERIEFFRTPDNEIKAWRLSHKDGLAEPANDEAIRKKPAGRELTANQAGKLLERLKQDLDLYQVASGEARKHERATADKTIEAMTAPDETAEKIARLFSRAGERLQRRQPAKMAARLAILGRLPFRHKSPDQEPPQTDR